MTILAMLLAAFFAMNMGGSGMSPAFAPCYGAGAIKRATAALLFGLFVLLGAYIGGGRVVNTISRGVVPQEFISTTVTLIILLSAALSLFVSNLLRVSVSTSSVTVFSLVSVGLYFRQLHVAMLLRILGFWFLLPILAYVLTHLLARIILPLEKKGLLEKHSRLLRILVIAIGCYMAFSIGTNNVANAVGPLVASKILSEKLGFLIIAPFFGIGGFLFRRVLDTVGKEITQIGLLGAATSGAVIGSLLLTASAFGIPEPMVMMDAVSIMGIGSVNRGHRYLITHQVVRKIASMWLISPLISLAITYLLLLLLVR